MSVRRHLCKEMYQYNEDGESMDIKETTLYGRRYWKLVHGVSSFLYTLEVTHCMFCGEKFP